MDDAERQRTMDFILRQQAQLAASAQRNEEEHAQFTESLKQLNKSVRQLGRIAVGMARQYRSDRTDLRERIAALINAQMKSEEKQSRSGEWQAQMEKNFARSEERMTRLEADAERTRRDLDALKYAVESHDDDINALFLINKSNSEAITKLTASNDRNSEAIAKLADVVASLGRRRNGGEESA